MKQKFITTILLLTVICLLGAVGYLTVILYRKSGQGDQRVSQSSRSIETPPPQSSYVQSSLPNGSDGKIFPIPNGTGDRIYPTFGSQSAPVTLTIYGGHPFVDFGRERTWAFVEKRYVQSGVLRVVFRPIHFSVFGPPPPPDVNPLIGALCAHDQGKFWIFTNSLSGQATKAAAEKAGLGLGDWEQCVLKGNKQAIVTQSSDAMIKEGGVSGFPAWRINAEVVNGGTAWDERVESFFQELERHLRLDKTDNRETYSNQHFELHYPADWSVVVGGAYTVLDRAERAAQYPKYNPYQQHDDNAVSIRTVGLTEERTYQEWLNQMFQYEVLGKKLEQVTSGIYTWDHYEAERGKRISSVTRAGDRVYVISTARNGDNMSQYDSIIASFKAIE